MSDQENAGIVNLTAPVVMIHPNLFVPKAFKARGKETGEPKYSASFLFAPDNPDLLSIKRAAKAVAAAKWPGRPVSELATPWTSGDKLADKRKAKGRNDGEFQRGHLVMAARSKFQPRLAVVENGRIVDLDESNMTAFKARFYFGVEVLAQFNLVAYEGVGANPDGVNAYLNMVLSTNKGKRLSSGSSAAEVFRGYVGTYSAEDPTGDGDPRDAAGW